MARSKTQKFYDEHRITRNRNSALEREALIENMYVRILSELAMNRFKWSNLPPDVNPRFIEYSLFQRGLIIGFRARDYGDTFMMLQGSPAGPQNMMLEPTEYQVTGNNFISRHLSVSQCVPVWSNMMRIPDWDIVNVYSNKLANIDRTIEINAKSARRTKIVAVSDQQRLTLRNIVKEIDEGNPIIEVNANQYDAALNNSIMNLDLGVDPDNIEKLHIVKVRLWNECMGLLGIENSNQDKKERLVSAEVGANDDQTSTMRYVALNSRREGARLINQRYGFGIKVDFWTDTDRAQGQLAGAPTTGASTAPVLRDED